jgi:hypothetical protein
MMAKTTIMLQNYPQQKKQATMRQKDDSWQE